jgi:hypothetical protein
MRHIHATVVGGPSGRGPKFELGPRCANDADGFRETLTLNVEDAVPFAARVSELGVKLQLTPESAPPQAKLTVPGTKFVERSDKLKVAEPPTLMTADAGETEAVTALRLKLPDTLSPLESPLRRTSLALPELPCHVA